VGAYLITGASSGIGEQLVREAVTRGHTVYGAARRREKLEELKSELGGMFAPLVLDVADKQAVRTACDGLAILPDVVVLDAGLGDADAKKEFDIGVHERLFAVNYFGALHFVDALFGRFVERGSGTFAAVSSLAGYRGLPGTAAYCASKAAVSVAFESMRCTYPFSRTGVRFITVHPGFVDTPMTSVNKFKMPFLWTPKKAARWILDGIECGKPHINFPWPMWLLLTLTRLVPPRIYARLMAGQDRR
jgi:NAD(P)-dependent dehydrogenase (short-subunit alcohol dehydrogenase family)